MTYVIALVVDVLAPRFGGESNFIAALKLSAYSYTAAFIGGIAHILGADRRTAGDRRDDLRVVHVLPRRAGAEEVRAGQGGAVHHRRRASCGIAIGMMIGIVFGRLGMSPAIG